MYMSSLQLRVKKLYNTNCPIITIIRKLILYKSKRGKKTYRAINIRDPEHHRYYKNPAQ